MTQFDRGDPTSQPHSRILEERAWNARGVSVLRSAAGIGRFHFGFSSEPRVAVLYGLNGSGKSRVLRHISAALGGAPAEVPATLHIELQNPRYCPPSTLLTNWMWGILIELFRELADRPRAQARSAEGGHEAATNPGTGAAGARLACIDLDGE